MTAAELAARLLQMHPEYGAKRAGEVADRLYMLRKRTSDDERNSEDRWLERIRAQC